jgi:hypothetical protein
MNYGFKLGRRLIAALVLAALTTITASAGSNSSKEGYRETTWKQELANKKHREVVLSGSIEFPKGGSKFTTPTGVMIRAKNYKPNQLR